MDLVGYIAVAIVGYFLGSIPTGFLLARARGIDIRKVGSGNIGATNAFRILGKVAGVTVLLVDFLKGAVACAFAGDIAMKMLGANVPLGVEAEEYTRMVAGFSAILGHNYTCWLRFKGGKGIATSAGVLLALMPQALLIAFSTFLVVLAISRIVSLGSIAAAAVLPLGAWWAGMSDRMIGLAVLIGALAIYKHRSNLQRIRQGTEPRFGAKEGQNKSSSTAAKPKA